MLKALALLARRGDALIVPSAVAPTATEPGACSSPRLPPCWCTPGVLSTMSSGTAGAAVASGDAQELRTHAAGAQARSARPGIASSHGPPILLGIATQLGSRRPKAAAASTPDKTSLRRVCGSARKGAGVHRAAAAAASEAAASPFHTCRRGAWQCEPWRCHAGAASRHGSTTLPPHHRHPHDASPHTPV